MSKNDDAKSALQVQDVELAAQDKRLTTKRSDTFEIIKKLEADTAANELAIGEAMRRGTKAPSREGLQNKLADAHADVVAIDRELAKVRAQRADIAKKIAVVRQAEHDEKFGAALKVYFEKEAELVERYYRPVVALWLEDSRRLPNFTIPSYDPEAMEHRHAQAEKFLNPPKPTPLSKSHVLMRFKKSWSGSTAASVYGFTTAYPEGAIAAFSLKVADQLERVGAACYQPNQK
jgi:chorismate mutase